MKINFEKIQYMCIGEKRNDICVEDKPISHYEIVKYLDPKKKRDNG